MEAVGTAAFGGPEGAGTGTAADSFGTTGGGTVAAAGAISSRDDTGAATATGAFSATGAAAAGGTPVAARFIPGGAIIRPTFVSVGFPGSRNVL